MLIKQNKHALGRTFTLEYYIIPSSYMYHKQFLKANTVFGYANYTHIIHPTDYQKCHSSRYNVGLIKHMLYTTFFPGPLKELFAEVSRPPALHPPLPQNPVGFNHNLPSFLSQSSVTSQYFFVLNFPCSNYCVVSLS